MHNYSCQSFHLYLSGFSLQITWLFIYIISPFQMSCNMFPFIPLFRVCVCLCGAACFYFFPSWFMGFVSCFAKHFLLPRLYDFLKNNLYMAREQRMIEHLSFFTTSFLQMLKSTSPWEKNDIAFNGAEHVWNHQV